MLETALRWHRGDRAFEHFQEGLLDTQTQILEARPAPLDLVDFVDEDCATLSSGNVGCE